MITALNWSGLALFGPHFGKLCSLLMSQPWLRTAFKTLGWNFPNEDIHLLLKVIPDVFNFCVEQINRLSSARQLGLCSRPYRNVNVRFTWPKYRMARLKSFCESTLLSSHCIRITLFFLISRTTSFVNFVRQFYQEQTRKIMITIFGIFHPIQHHPFTSIR